MSEIQPTLPEPRALPFRRPADYYAAPPSEVRPLFPRWVPLGCGTASILAVLLLFGAGAIAGSGRGSAIFATLFGTMADEIDGMFTKEVTPVQKKAFHAEMKSLETNLADGKLSLDHLQPVLHAIRDAAGDSKVTPDETEKLTKAAREANRAAKPAPSGTVRH